MTPIAGWYMDPQSPGRLRYWDGQQWTEHTTQPPPVAPGWAAAGPIHASGSAVPGSATPERVLPVNGRRASGRSWFLGGGAVVLAMVLAVGWAFGSRGPRTEQAQGRATSTPSASRPGGSIASAPTVPAPSRSLRGAPLTPPSLPEASTDSAPPSAGADATPDECRAGGDGAQQPPTITTDRVVAGGLSMPIAPPPFPEPVAFDPATDPVVLPLSERGAIQSMQVAEYKNSGWGAAMVIAPMRAIPGVSTVKDAAALLTRCMEQTQYSVASVEARTVSSAAATVDGRPAWQVEYQVMLDDPALAITKETGLVSVVEVESGRFVYFWASIPDLDDGGILLAAARASQRGLSIE